MPSMSGLALRRMPFSDASDLRLCGVSRGPCGKRTGNPVKWDSRRRAGAVLGCVGVSGDTSDNDEFAAVAGITSASLVPQPD
jgi:hypothetical protein